MNYGLYVSASGALTSMYRMDVAANNLANVNTVGFRADHAAVQQRATVRREDGIGGGWGEHGAALLERLGGGVRMGANAVDRSQGQTLPSDNPLDVAVVGEGFLVVRPAENTGGTGGIRLSRDGRLTLDPNGKLIQAGSGAAVLDRNGREIVVSGAAGAGGERDRSVHIAADGTVSYATGSGGAAGGGRSVVGRMYVATPRGSEAEGVRLEKSGNGAMRVISGDREMGLEGLRDGSGSVRQGALEQSTVDPIMAMLAAMDAERSAASNVRMIQTQDELLGRLIQGVGRVA